MMMVCACWSEEAGIARVGDRSIDLETYQAYVASATGEPWAKAGERVASTLLDQFLDEEVILVAAERLEHRPVGEWRVEPRSALVRDLVVEVCGPAPSPDAEGVRREVERRMNEEQPLRARVRQLLFSDRETAEAALESLENGVPWERVSQMLSEAPNADRGGGLGIVTEGQLPPSVEPIVFGLQEDEWSKSVDGPGGYHVFQVLERFEPAQRDRADLEARVRATMSERAARRHIRSCVRALASDIGVKVRIDRLWFRYDGRYVEGEDEGL